MHYPWDSNTHAIETQFFYGPSLLINPVTEEKSNSVSIYLPFDTWYDFFTQMPVPHHAVGAKVVYNNVTDTDIPILVRGGSIIPLRTKSAMTTRALRNEDFELVIAPDKDGNARGSLYLDDGESIEQDGVSEIEFTWNGETIRADGAFGFATRVGVKSLSVLGAATQKYKLGEDLSGPWEHKAGDLERQ